jgi:DNA-binding response OmpR family regulator
MGATILVVEDDVDVAETIRRQLSRAGFEVLVTHRGADALSLARRQPPDLMVLDVKMPGMSGVEVCRHVRANPQLAPIPILFLTGKKDITDKIAGFEAGADDYLVKPYDHTELELRVRALLRRTRSDGMMQEVDFVRVGDLELNCHTYEIKSPGRSELLTPVEYQLMRFLMSSPGKVFSADELLHQVWDYPRGTGTTDLVRVHVRNIRAKIEPDMSAPIYLRNLPRRGYAIFPEGGDGENSEPGD